MAFNIGAILGTLVLDSSKWDNSIKRAKTDMKSFEGAVLRNEGAIKRFGIALGVAGAAITAMNVKLVKMAAAAEESENLFEVSMGGMADSAREWSKGLSDSLGLNQYEIRRTVGLMDVMLKSMGLSEDAAYRMSTSLVQLSQDMASLYNMSPDEAFQKIQAGITGETEPLKRLGIIVNETTVKNWALTKGIIKQGQELTEIQKVLARYGVIMDSTKVAQGDLARTIDSTTNQARVFSSKISELGVKLGTILLPAVNTFLHLANYLVKSLTQLVDKFPKVTAAVVGFTAAMGVLMTVAGAVLLILPGLAAAAAAMGTTMGAMALGVTVGMTKVAVAVGLVAVAFQKWDIVLLYMQGFAKAMNEWVVGILDGLYDFVVLLEKLPGVTEKMTKGIKEALVGQSLGFQEVADSLGVLMEQQADKIAQKNAEVKKNTEDMVSGIVDTLENGLDGVGDKVTSSLKEIQWGTASWVYQVQTSFNAFEEMGRRTFNAAADSFSNLFYDSVMGELTSLQDAFASFGQAVLRVITDIIAQWMVMKMVTGIFGTAAVAGTGGYLEGTPTGAMDMGSYTKLPSYDVGTDYVPYDMIAKVHKGEKITPAAENGGGGVIQLTIQNAITTEAVAKAMESRAGQKTIVNVIRADSSMNGVTKREVQTR